MLSTEYMVEHILKNTQSDQTFFVFSVVDYDPSGWIVESNFIDLLKDQGLKTIESTTLIHPRHYSEEELLLNRYEIPSGKKADTINERWFDATGGIGGELYGLEAESLPIERLLDLVEREMERLRIRS
ncbi:MAG: hypothetical protein HY776_07005 [Actinobacteria bacterium]|nr:hypothetical protein [Actinomycetota bacterium]